MASIVKTDSFSGGAAVQPGGSAGKDDLATMLRDAVDDIAALRAAIVGITAKLDLDAGVTDTNYAATHDPAAQALTKG